MQNGHYGFLKGGGEMGERIRSFNWKDTPVGCPGTWPSALRNTVSIILNSRFPMFLLWGEDYIQFYNDAYRPSFGSNGKHPEALGQGGRECWKEAWTVLGPLLEQVRLGGEAVWKEDQPVPIFRNGQIEETFWTFSYSPVLDDDGKVAGVLSTCVETTEKIQSIQKLQESKDELAFAIEATELGTWDLNPVSGKFTANNRLKEWFGLKPDDEIPLLHAIDVIAEYDRERINQSISHTLEYESGGRYQTTYTIIHPHTKRQRIVLAKGRAWFGADKKAYRFNGTLQDITEQAEVENRFKNVSLTVNEKIAESREQLLNSFEDSPVAIATIDKNGLTFTMANSFYGELVGRKSKDIIGKPFPEALPELVGQGFDKLLEQVIASGELYTSKEVSVDVVRYGKPETIYVDFVYQPQYDSDKQVIGVLVIATDVTAQVVSRKKLEESERFTRHIFYNSPVAKLVYIGPDMILREANEAMLSIFGRDESILNKPIMETIPELQQSDLLQKYRRVLHTGEAHYEYAQRILLIKNKEKYYGYYDYIYKPLRNSNDEIYGIVCTAVDVTKEVTARKQIEAAEASLRNAIDLAELATWSVDVVKGSITYSDRLQHWLGIEDAKLEIKSSPRIHPKDRDRVGNAMKAALEPGAGYFDETYTIVHSITQQERIIHSSGRVIYDDNGNALSIKGTAQDVTLQQELQKALEIEVQQRTEELEVINEDLRRSNEELSQYAYVASHDLQEPLRKIRVFAGILTDQKDVSEINKNYLEKINRSAARMSLLIHDLLEFSRLLKSEKMKTQVDLNIVVQEVLNDFELLIREKQAVFKIATLPTIEAIALQMNQLFYNIISNSLKFVKQGVQPTIKIECRIITPEELALLTRRSLNDKTYYKISISDNGIGFDSKYTDQIFEVFKRLHEREVYPGSGIGLALCRRIAANHDGYLYSESTPGQGSVFHIILPQ